MFDHTDIIICEGEKEEVVILKRILHVLHQIEHNTRPPKITTPLAITFRRIVMLDPVAGNTLVYTGTLSPAGSKFPSGTTFTVTSNYPNVTPTVDDTGLVVTIPLGSDFVDDPNNPLSVNWETSTFTPSPDTSPNQLRATITPTIPTVTPTGIDFVQTT